MFFFDICKTLLFALIKVSTFICKREISGLSSPLIKHCLTKSLFLQLAPSFYREIIYVNIKKLFVYLTPKKHYDAK